MWILARRQSCFSQMNAGPYPAHARECYPITQEELEMVSTMEEKSIFSGTRTFGIWKRNGKDI